MRQYYPTWVKLPKAGQIVKLGKDGKVYELGVVTGVYPRSRIAIICPVKGVTEDGKQLERKI